MKEKILELLNDKKYFELKKELNRLHEVDIAEVLMDLDIKKVIIIFRLLSKDIAANVFTNLNSEIRENIIKAATDKEIKSLLNESFFDNIIDLIEEMPSNVVKKIIKNTTKDERKLINQFLDYPDNSAGSIMTIEYIGIKENMTVKQAKEYIKNADVEEETADICFVLTMDRILKGTIPIRRLVLNEDNKMIGDLMDTDVIAINTLNTKDECINIFKKYDLIASPVVDKEERLVGLITIDDVVDVIEQENTEDFQRIAATLPTNESYLNTSVLNLAKNRIVWLLVLMISATLSARVIKQYDNILQSVVILVAFIPMLMGTGGNSGSQASTLIIRGMALDEILTKDILKVLWKELRVSLIVGLILAGVNFLRIVYIEKVEINIALIVCSTLLVTVIIAKLLGGSLPIIAKKFKLDPAIMASPLITTILDVLVLFIYMNISKIILGL